MAAHVYREVPGYEGCAECAICWGFEGSLPSECPGRRMTRGEAQRVYAGALDFRAGRWWNQGRRGLVIRLRDYMPGYAGPLDAVDRWGLGEKARAS